MSKTTFLKQMEKLYEEVQDLGITANQLFSHIHNNVSLPKEEGWIALEELIEQTGLENICKVPQCYGYEVRAEGERGSQFHVFFEENRIPRITVIMYDIDGSPWGYEERVFRNPREVGDWLRDTLTYFMCTYQMRDN